MSDLLQELFESTASLYERFGVSDTHPLNRQRIFMEEALELIQASAKLSFYDDTGNITPVVVVQNTVDEAADVLVTVCGLLLAHEIDPDALSKSIERVIAKNDAKTGTTHELINGKITRRTKVKSS